MAELDFDDEQQEINYQEPVPEPSFFEKNRRLIIGSGVAVLIASGVYFFALRDGSGKAIDTAKRKASNLEQNYADKMEDPKEKKKKEESKKNKKLKYIKLYDLSTEDTSKALKELSMADIAFTTEQKGKTFAVSVDEKKVEEAKNLLAQKGIPGGTSKGYELLDNSQTLGVTEFDKRVRFVRALSGELEKAILQFEMIENCKVQIVLPEQRLFAVTQPPVTASILVRKYPGTKITDDVVFSIIQLVANAVENLQPENVSVIDTEGIVLSNGIFERMAAKDARRRGPIQTSENVNAKLEESTTAVGTPVIPNFEEIRKWQEVKEKFEANLENKALDQLIGILPEGSFKVAITADLGPLENGEIVDIKRITTSIVVDNSRQDIFLDPLLKKQIFNTIASAIGYVKGRDTIQLNKADFRLLSEEERKKLLSKQRRTRLTKQFFQYLPFALGGGAAILGSVAIFRRIRKRIKSSPNPLDEFTMDEMDNQESADFESMQSEMSTEKQIDEIQRLAGNNLEETAQLIENWIQDGA